MLSLEAVIIESTLANLWFTLENEFKISPKDSFTSATILHLFQIVKHHPL